jgi:hypothetical protein
MLGDAEHNGNIKFKWIALITACPEADNDGDKNGYSYRQKGGKLSL